MFFLLLSRWALFLLYRKLLEKRREEKIKACEKQAQERYSRLKNKETF